MFRAGHLAPNTSITFLMMVCLTEIKVSNPDRSVKILSLTGLYPESRVLIIWFRHWFNSSSTLPETDGRNTKYSFGIRGHSLSSKVTLFASESIASDIFLPLYLTLPVTNSGTLNE